MIYYTTAVKNNAFSSGIVVTYWPNHNALMINAYLTDFRQVEKKKKT